MQIAAPSRGYSAAASFIDPEMTSSQRWHGNGLRLKNLDGTTLEPVLTVRNTGNQLSHIQGRIIYTRSDGATSTVDLQQRQIAPGATRVFRLGNLIKNARIPDGVTYSGIELEYDTPKGTITTSVQSISSNGNHVFQVPMFDPASMPASAGGFPWKADGDYTTVVYIKNETAMPHKFVSHLIYEGGQYSFGIRDLKPGQTMAIDFRELRDSQSPDSQGNLIPLDIDNGQIAWSVLGAVDKVLSGRSEQISLTEGVASTYACANCCPNVITAVYVDPYGLTTELGLTNQFTTTQTEQNCYGTEFGPYGGFANQWSSFNTNVATVDFTGNSDAVGVGGTNIQGCVERTIWFNWGGGYCEPFTDMMCNDAPMEVLQPTLSGPAEVDRGSSATFTVENASTGISGWQFSDGTNTVTRTTSTGSTTWTGTMVKSGTISVTVTVNGQSTPLSKSITVKARTSFAFSAVTATKVNNGSSNGDGGTVSVANPPVSGGHLGVFYLRQKFSVQTNEVTDGPNKGFKYVTSVTSSFNNVSTAYLYAVPEDAENTSSTFYMKQCGNYNAQTNPGGFISGADLLAGFSVTRLAQPTVIIRTM